ncbi:hypothetical protein BV22DRAFT_1134422 [Leucogyrophana mollusca]|uniref:Uncharacterized protein n=1 Tax=Leucogyrophana mollusca TaxID=85980 RepID=A0ACB8AZI0_9AGAM|nr:hypothetical protein BV22DRAFT_1134422 [Leucogyrophana mollusca]
MASVSTASSPTVASHAGSDFSGQRPVMAINISDPSVALTLQQFSMLVEEEKNSELHLFDVRAERSRLKSQLFGSQRGHALKCSIETQEGIKNILSILDSLGVVPTSPPVRKRMAQDPHGVLRQVVMAYNTTNNTACVV